MPETRTVTVYSLQELGERAKEKALQTLSEWAGSDRWWDSTVDDAKRMGAILGIEATDIFFSGFWSQGDGACFVGTYSYKPQSRNIIRTEAPEDTELHKIADTLFRIQRRNFYRLTAAVRKFGNYYSHENSVTVDVDDTATPEDKDAIADALRDFMRWIYKQLRTEYEYRTSEEQLTEMADANEYRWNADGTLA
jgi:hypothetical protein